YHHIIVVDSHLPLLRDPLQPTRRLYETQRGLMARAENLFKTCAVHRTPAQRLHKNQSPRH
ncbi:MAG: hypothetical protein ACMV0I_08930, partial [Pseudomonas sp.]